MDPNTFIQKIQALTEQAAENGGMAAYAEIEETFREMQLDAAQMEMILTHLRQKGIRISGAPDGIETAAAGIAEAEQSDPAYAGAETDSADDAGEEEYLPEEDVSHDLTEDEEAALAAQIAAGSQAARDALILAHDSLVRRLAGERAGRGLPIQDLVQEGNIGLLMAMESYDFSMQRFAAHAEPLAAQMMDDALAEQSEASQEAEQLRQELEDLRQAEKAMLEETGLIPTPAELSEKTGKPLSRILDLQEIMKEADRGKR